MLTAGDLPSRRVMPHTLSASQLNGRRQHQPDLSSASSKVNFPLQTGFPDSMQHIWLITGPAGSGKTTVAKALAKELSLPYIEGDDYHPDSNKAKMSNGIPLTDADRWDWLITLRQVAVETLSKPIASDSADAVSNGVSKTDGASPLPIGVVVTCSALKTKYRDVIRVAAYTYPVRIHFIYLRADKETLLQRVGQRQGHYMKSSMVQSQLEMLEEPVAEWDALAIDCAASPAEVQRRVIDAVHKTLEEGENR